MARFDSGMGSSGGGQMVAAGVGGAAVGAGAVSAAQWARKVSRTAAVGMGLGVVNTGISVVGGNANNTQAIAAANLTNTINSRPVSPAATGPEVGMIKGDLAALSNIVAQIASNTDPMTVAGLRNGPTLPTPTTQTIPSSIPAPTSTTPASGFGNLGVLLLLAAAVYVITQD